MTDVNDLERVKSICLGDEEAMHFLLTWAEYCHALDDIVDGDRTDPEHIIRTAGMLPVVLFTHSFFLRSVQIASALRQVALLVANTYADSVAWERSASEWKRRHADVMRHAGNEMVFAVAQIVGGYDHARKLSAAQREVCYFSQHNEQQKEEA